MNKRPWTPWYKMVRKKLLFRVRIVFDDFGDVLENPRNEYFSGRLWWSIEIRSCHRKQALISREPSQVSVNLTKLVSPVLTALLKLPDYTPGSCVTKTQITATAIFFTSSYWSSEKALLLAALLSLRRRIKSHLLFTGIIRSSPFSPR